MNARKEFEEGFEGYEILCASISLFSTNFNLKVGGDLEEFLEKLDFTYSSGFGSQELDGTVWFKNGTWAERSEYDGSEWWTIMIMPEIPAELL